MTDPGDIVDRWAISRLKVERLGDTHLDRLAIMQAELDKLKVLYPNVKWDYFCNLLYAANASIWSFESGLKSGKEVMGNSSYFFDESNRPALVNIGLCALLIREFNALRIGIKNLLNATIGEGLQEVKGNHLSEVSNG